MKKTIKDITVDAWKVRLQYKDGQLKVVVFRHYLNENITKTDQSGEYKEGDIWDINLGSEKSQEKIEEWLKTK